MALWRHLLKRFHPEGIPWPGTVLYNRISRSFVFQDHYRLLAHDIAAHCPEGNLLDIGTGPGWLLLRLHECRPGLRLTGVDISPAMAAQAKHNAALAGVAKAIDIQAAAADHLPFAAGSFDIVVSTGSIHHWKDVGSGLGEVHRVLRPGGYGLMYDLVADTPPHVLKDLKQKYGLYRTLLLRLHSLEEPFQTVEEFESLAAATPFGTGQIRFVGVLCCLTLRKSPSSP